MNLSKGSGIRGRCAVACLLVLTGSCTAIHQVRFTVKASPLDYVQLRRTEPSGGGDLPVVTRLELAGSGYLELLSGRSARVRDGFWQESESPDWQDLTSDHVVLTAADTEAIYQRLVDAGVFDTQPEKKLAQRPDALVIQARIGFKKQILVTSDPVYIAIFDALLARFRR